MKVAVLMGGRSSEREISLRTGRGCAQALRNLGHEVPSVDAADGAVLPAGQEEFVEINARLAESWPNITHKKDAPADADDWKGVTGKRKYLEE